MGSEMCIRDRVINMLTDLVESIRKTDENMKPMLRETKENVQGTNSDGEGNWDPNQRCGPEGRKKHPTRKE